MQRSDILQTALATVTAERVDRHGKPEDSFAAIADLWEMYLAHRYGVEFSLSPEDVAVMMNLLKVARIATGSGANMDNFIDGAGYMACAGELASRKENAGHA